MYYAVCIYIYISIVGFYGGFTKFAAHAPSPPRADIKYGGIARTKFFSVIFPLFVSFIREKKIC